MFSYSKRHYISIRSVVCVECRSRKDLIPIACSLGSTYFTLAWNIKLSCVRFVVAAKSPVNRSGATSPNGGMNGSPSSSNHSPGLSKSDSSDALAVSPLRTLDSDSSDSSSSDSLPGQPENGSSAAPSKSAPNTDSVSSTDVVVQNKKVFIILPREYRNVRFNNASLNIINSLNLIGPALLLHQCNCRAATRCYSHFLLWWSYQRSCSQSPSSSSFSLLTLESYLFILIRST